MFLRFLTKLAAGLSQSLRRICRADDGNVSLIVAVMLPVMLGMAGLVIEYGHALVLQASQQRAADIAAYAGALAYGTTKSTSVMTSAARRAAQLNGFGGSTVTVELVASSRTTNNSSVHVTILSDNPMYLPQLVGVAGNVSILATAYADLGVAATGCVVALDGSLSGITLSGSGIINAPTCSVASNSGLTVPCGTSITGKTVTYVTTISRPCGGLNGTLSTAAASDPFAGNASIASARARFATLNAQSTPAAPVIAASTSYAIDFAWIQSSTIAQARAAGCTATFNSNTSTWTLTCPQGQGRVYNFSSVTITGGINLNFNTAGTAATTYNFASVFKTPTSGTITFGAGIYNFADGVIASGSAVTTFGAGTFTIGRSGTTCSGSTFSLCTISSGAMTFAGPSTFILQGGIANGSSGKLTLGAGTTNIFQIGASGAGDALYLASGSKTILADATTFELGGNIWGPNGGGSCVILGAAANHDIRGSVNLAGAAVLGAGVYTIDGYFALGATNGGGTACTGYSSTVRASNVSLVLSGRTALSSGTCSDTAFCVSGSYSNTQFIAPTSGTLANFAVIGPAVLTRGAKFAEGANNGKVSGAFYFPAGPISMSGSVGVSSAGNCLQLIGSQITISTGTTAASSCDVTGNTSGSRPRLVQ